MMKCCVQYMMEQDVHFASGKNGQPLMITLSYNDSVVTTICDWESATQEKVMQDASKFYCTKKNMVLILWMLI